MVSMVGTDGFVHSVFVLVKNSLLASLLRLPRSENNCRKTGATDQNQKV